MSLAEKILNLLTYKQFLYIVDTSSLEEIVGLMNVISDLQFISFWCKLSKDRPGIFKILQEDSTLENKISKVFLG